MLDKILIIDFEDSFTYNIASVLYEEVPLCKVVTHQDFFSHKYDEWKKQQGRKGIILGPGPGHPEIHRKYFPQIKDLISDENIFVMGICLGHQIIGLMNELTVGPVQNQVHGQVVDVQLNGEIKSVQRYNSLGVFENGVEKISLKWGRGVTYQFHPESIGTDNSLSYFESLLNFIRD